MQSDAQKREILEQHNRTVQHMKTRSFPGQTSFTNGLQVKEKSTRDRKDCTPIEISELEVGRVHVGRVLRGTLIAEPYMMAGVANVLRDEAGDLVAVAVYNISGGSSFLRRGAHIEILEPFYKIRQDGTIGIRVENADEVKFLESLGPSQQVDFEAKGNMHFDKKEYEKAADCFSRALEEKDGGNHVTSICLCNLSHSIQCENPQNAAQSLACAGAAIAINPKYAKAWIRMANSLEALKMEGLALFCVFEAKRLGIALDENALAMVSRLKAAISGAAGKIPTNKRTVFVAVAEMGCRVISILTEVVNKSADTDILERCKLQGNELFQQGLYAEANAKYGFVVMSAKAWANSLLCKRALCYHRLGKSVESLLDANSCVLIDGRSMHGYTHLSKGFKDLGKYCALGKVANEALVQFPDEDSFVKIGRDARVLLELDKIKATLPNTNGVSISESLISERELDSSKKNQYSSRDLAEFNDMLAMTEKAHKKKNKHKDPKLQKLLGWMKQIPQFHHEFSKRGVWPAECNRDQCKEKLAVAYEIARGMPRIEDEMSSLENVFPGLLFERLGSSAHVEWWTHAPIGDIRKWGQEPNYDCRIFHSFSNAINRSEQLVAGSTHVAIGFVDLGILREAILVEDAAGICSSSKPLQWIGFEASAYSVAKTAVIADMLANDDASVDSILQVWYSAAWSCQTLELFKASVRSVITKIITETSPPHYLRLRHPEIVDILSYWLTQEVSLEQARNDWLRENTGSKAEIANFKREIDRIAYCNYILTGQLLNADVGSVCMFAIPPAMSNRGISRALNESVFHNIDVACLYSNWIKTKNDIVSVATDHLRTRIAMISNDVKAGKITIEVRLQSLEPKGTESTLSDIQKLNAYSMSWSNVCDYYSPRDFHMMARACSGPDTVHFMYTMNWSQSVKGASVLDWYGNTRALQAMLEAANTSYEKRNNHLGVAEFLASPPVQDPRNLVDFVARSSFISKWTSMFFSEAGNPPPQVFPMEIQPLNFLEKCVGITLLIYSYSHEINLFEAK